jgi:hypothetical protein
MLVWPRINIHDGAFYFLFISLIIVPNNSRAVTDKYKMGVSAWSDQYTYV